MRRLLLPLFLVAGLIAAGAGFAKEARIYTVPIRVHLITGAEFAADGTTIDLWLTPEEFTKEVLPEMNRIWQPAGVRWRVASLEVQAAAKGRAGPSQRSQAENVWIA